MRIKLLNLIAAKPDHPIYLDWDNVTVVASSFADEFMGKLYLRLGKEKYDKKIRHVKIQPLIIQLIEKAIAERTAHPDDSMET
jgi:hypothetical protein